MPGAYRDTDIKETTGAETLRRYIGGMGPAPVGTPAIRMGKRHEKQNSLRMLLEKTPASGQMPTARTSVQPNSRVAIVIPLRRNALIVVSPLRSLGFETRGHRPQLPRESPLA